MKIEKSVSSANMLISNIEKAVKGKRSQIILAVITLLAKGHIIIEDIPGVGKTMLARALAASLNLEFKRIQCTPDLLPSDITGSMIFDGKAGFYFSPGPVFTQILLADELNRATPRTQSALLEAMDEFKISVDGETRHLPVPFFVVATLNPLEHHGTFPLPEGQLDRFLIRISMGYPDSGTEKEIIRGNIPHDPIENLTSVMTNEDVFSLQENVKKVSVSDEVISYAHQIIDKTRSDERIHIGASVRASIGLIRASQAKALIEGRDFITPDDVKYLARFVIAHRIHLEGIGDESTREIIEQIVSEVPVAI